jgi:hypothetical protein
MHDETTATLTLRVGGPVLSDFRAIGLERLRAAHESGEDPDGYADEGATILAAVGWPTGGPLPTEAQVGPHVIAVILEQARHDLDCALDELAERNAGAASGHVEWGDGNTAAWELASRSRRVIDATAALAGEVIPAGI